MASTKSAERIQELLEDGLRALDSSDLEGALTAWHQILDLDPKHERAARLVADLEALVGQQHRARELTGEVLVVVDEGDANAAESLQPTPGVVSRRGLARLQRLVETQSDENRQLSDTVGKRYNEILELREQLTGAEKQVLTLRERLAVFERTTATIEVERADLGRVRGLFEHQITLFEFRVAEQKQFEGTLRQQLVDTQAELERVRLSVESERSEHAATRTLLEEAQSQVEQVQSQVEQVQSQVEQAQSQAEQVQRRMDVAAGEIGGLRRELEKERGVAEMAAARAHESGTALAEMTAKFEARAQQSDALNTALSEALELAEQHAITAGTLQTEVEALQGSVVELDIARATISNLEKTQKDLSASIAALEARAVSFEGEKSALIDQTQAHIDSAITELSGQLAELRAAVDSREVTIRALTEAGMSEARTTSRLKQELANANARINELESGGAASRQLEEQLANLQAENAALNDDIAGRDLAIEALRNELRQRDDRLTEITQNLSRPRQTGSHEIGRSVARISELENEVLSLREQLAHNEPPAPGHAAYDRFDVSDSGEGAFDQAHETARLHPANMVSQTIADGAASEQLNESSDTDNVNAVTDSDFMATAPVADFSDFVVPPASNPPMPGPNERPTGTWDAVSLFDEMATDPGRRQATVAPDWMGPVPGDATLPPPGTGDFPATSNNFGFDDEAEPLFDMEVDEPAPALAPKAAPAVAAPPSTHTITGMAFLAEEAQAVRGTATPPPQPPPPPEGPARGKGKKAGQLSMRSSATARLADTTLSPAEQLSWLVDEVPRLTNAGANMIRSKQIGAKEAFVVEAIDGSVSFADIVDVVGLPSHETSAILVDLLRRGVISSPSVE